MSKLVSYEELTYPPYSFFGGAQGVGVEATNKIYLTRPEKGTEYLVEYDPSTDSYTDFQTSKYFDTVESDGSYIYNLSSYRSFYYDPSTDSVTTLSATPSADFPRLVYDGTDIWIFGDGGGLSKYDISTDTIDSSYTDPPNSVPEATPPAVLGKGGDVLFCPYYDYPTEFTQIYDIASDTWSTGPGDSDYDGLEDCATSLSPAVQGFLWPRPDYRLHTMYSTKKFKHDNSYFTHMVAVLGNYAYGFNDNVNGNGDAVRWNFGGAPSMPNNTVNTYQNGG